MINFKTEKTRQECGAISIAFALSVIVLVFLLAVTTMSYVGSDTKSASNQLIKNKAFYAAEAGIELALGELKNGGDGEFTNVTIGEAMVTSTVTGDTLISISSTVVDITKTLEVAVNVQSGTLPDAFYYAVSSFKTSKKLQFKGSHSPYLNGQIFSNTDDKVKFESNWVLGIVTVHVEEGTTIDNQTSYSYTLDEFTSGNPPISWPTLDTQYYDDYINNVGGYSEYPDDEIDYNLNLSTLTDGVLYIDPSEELDIEGGCTITGPGVIVSTKDIDIDEGATIINAIIIADGKLEVSEGATISGMGSVLYSNDKVEIEDEDTSVMGSIISADDIVIDCDSNFSDRGIIQGIIYAGDKAKIRHTRIHGSVVANYIDGEDFHCTHMDYNASYLPTTIPPGFSGGGGIVVTVKNGTWKEQ